MDHISLNVFCSGCLGEAVLKKLLANPAFDIKGVLTDHSSVEIIKRVKQLGIPIHIGNPRRNNFANKLVQADILISANYFFILPDSIISLANRMAVNIHGSLLPKYMGRTPNTWVIINDEVETGITVHKIVAEVDSGDIIYQEKIPILNKDTAGTLTGKMMERYPEIAEKVIFEIVKGNINKRKQDLLKKTYCCKREPSDGLINWDWSSRKIYNWVRAQTRPYKGAFFIYEKSKYILWLVEDCYDKMDNLGLQKGIPFEKDGNVYIRCGIGSVKVVDFEILEKSEA
jgi:methionyl-tRNA formyltransferase|tara:strand:- start:2360 stop:3217 length:858 start_codon:yes stop_codon:yes gene_type:complete